ncbi:AraC-type DNA-binding protein [Tenacibaculum sp. MAR_2009_124]|uniref:helix-turn-helix domain-containing protein n=1 Tax=Tenacibaculum sp. MAR_2009_124 TaxID=1250059 RepID=UPI00089C1DDD|nr:helix-turn-helix domain-containing protein [Tenacibaculum sp. MAR_2009_124]SEB39603.1 AraC-type DNA-binding protein [Tenacibaculum sp. MAR_2009_124]
MSFFSRFLLTITFLFLLNQHNFSQHNTVITDSITSKSFEELENLFYESKPDTLKAIMYANAKYYKALKEKDTMQILWSKYYLADIKNNDSIYLNFCDSLIKIYSVKPNKNFPTAIHLHKARFFYHRNKKSLILNELNQINNLNINNDSLNAIKNLYVGLSKFAIGKNHEALNYLKKSYKYINQKNQFNANDDFSSVPLNLTAAYIELKNYDSALYYNRKTLDIYRKLKDSVSLGYTFYNQASIYFDSGNHSSSIKSYKQSIPWIIEDENYRILCVVYSEVGKSYELIEDLGNALVYHLKSDSIYNQKKIKVKSLKYTLSFLSKHYKKQNNLEKQLHYINKLMELKEFRLTEKNKIQQTLTDEFDIPNLLAERKRIVEELEAKSKRNKIIFTSLLALLLALIGYQIRKNNIYKKRFQTLISKQKDNLKTIHPSTKEESKPKLELSESIVAFILEQLKKFEESNEFINIDLNLQYLASKFDTNASYLSKVINYHKHTSFSNYINKLRIEYCVEQLKNNELWRRYTIKAIANEVGFNKAESFSKAFFKYTELRPSYFIKELKKTQTSNISNET